MRTIDACPRQLAVALRLLHAIQVDYAVMGLLDDLRVPPYVAGVALDPLYTRLLQDAKDADRYTPNNGRQRQWERAVFGRFPTDAIKAEGVHVTHEFDTKQALWLAENYPYRFAELVRTVQED